MADGEKLGDLIGRLRQLGHNFDLRTEAADAIESLVIETDDAWLYREEDIQRLSGENTALRASLKECRNQLGWCNQEFGPHASTNFVMTAADRVLVSTRQCSHVSRDMDNDEDCPICDDIQQKRCSLCGLYYCDCAPEP